MQQRKPGLLTNIDPFVVRPVSAQEMVSARAYVIRCEGWDENWPHEPAYIPARSTLANLQPEGLGTPFVESLSSFVMRLAGAHAVTHTQLFLRVIAPVIQAQNGGARKLSAGLYEGADAAQRDKTPFLSFSFSAAGGGSYLNGTQNTKQERLIPALEALTLRTDLRSLTLSRWSNVLASKNLIRPTKAWCPACYENRRLLGLPVYDQLLWAISVVTLCPEHGMPLETHCPDCGERARYLSGHTQPGYCPNCQGWLGSVQPHPGTPKLAATRKDGGEGGEWGLWAARAVGGLLAYPGESTGLGGLRSVVQRVIAEVFEGKPSKFWREMGLSNNTLQAWERNRKSVRLETLLYICYCANQDPLDVLIAPDHVLQEWPPLDALKLMERVRHAPRPTTRNSPDTLAEIGQRLKDILSDPESAHLNAAAVTAQLGVDKFQTIRNHFPEEYRVLSGRYKEWRAARSAQSIRATIDAVAYLVVKLRGQGLTPHWIRIQNALREDYPELVGMTRQPGVYDAYLAARGRDPVPLQSISIEYGEKRDG